MQMGFNGLDYPLGGAVNTCRRCMYVCLYVFEPVLLATKTSKQLRLRQCIVFLQNENVFKLKYDPPTGLFILYIYTCIHIQIYLKSELSIIC